MFSNNTDGETRKQITNLSRSKETLELGKYLSVPLTVRRPKMKYYQYLVEQVKNKLYRWRGDQLSFAGRATLIKVVFEEGPTCHMTSNMVPQACLQEIQKIQRGFIWGDIDGKRHIHTIRWDELAKPKKQ
ncbi:unnamed protein product [Lathyrus oleraceus]